MLSIDDLNAKIKSGIIAIVGRANVGKSTLLNGILEEKVSIVSDVAQTTRNLIRAVLTEPRGQLVFLDTPGVHRATYDLGKMMNRMARSSVEGADVVMLVLDGSERPFEEDDGWMRKIAKQALPAVIVLNKIDLGTPYADEYRAQWEDISRKNPDHCAAVPWFDISAANHDGVAELVQALFDRVPLGPPLFSEDVLTDFPRKLAMGDVIREKLFHELHDELPHAIAVGVNHIDESPETGWLAHADIYVNRPSQKGIVIGQKGRLLRKIKRLAEKDISDMYDVPVTLELWVKVEKDWAKNFWILRQLGYA
ncbi:MAG: GTPase Era [Lentisphaeria bacterium]|nr:GTPase Era [Lentisphaeria bacterium]